LFSWTVIGRSPHGECEQYKCKSHHSLA
jgi:hypothetical protein